MKPDDGVIYYLVNPKSGVSSSKLMSRRFYRYLVGKGFDVRIQQTVSLTHAADLARRAAADTDCALVAAVGGDGTVREVAHGLSGSNKPLLIVPCGTENLLAHEMGFDHRLRTLVRTFEGDNRRPLDLGRVNGRVFASLIGVGFDGEVVDRVSRRRTGHIDHLEYVEPIWRAFWGYRFDPLTVTVDGQTIVENAGLVFVGNISRFALGLNVLRDADYGDGLLDICAYRCTGRLSLLAHTARTIVKRHVRPPGVVYQQGKVVEVSGAVPDVKTQIDGDPGPVLPVRIEVIPGAVTCIVPEGAGPTGMAKRLWRAVF